MGWSKPHAPCCAPLCSPPQPPPCLSVPLPDSRATRSCRTEIYYTNALLLLVKPSRTVIFVDQKQSIDSYAEVEPHRAARRLGFLLSRLLGSSRLFLPASHAIRFCRNEIYNTHTSMTQSCSNFRTLLRAALVSSSASCLALFTSSRNARHPLLPQRNVPHKCSTITSMTQSCSNFRTLLRAALVSSSASSLAFLGRVRQSETLALSLSLSL